MELRAAPRFPVAAPVSFSGHRIAGEGRIVNISAHGMMIQSPWPVNPGKSLSLRVLLSDREEPLGIQIGEVRWAQGGRFGIRPVLMAMADWQRLRQWASHLEGKRNYVTR